MGELDLEEISKDDFRTHAFRVFDMAQKKTTTRQII